MKKAALFTLGLFVATQAYADGATRAKGVAKLAGSAGVAVYSLLTLKHGLLNLYESRSGSKFTDLTWFKTWIPFPTALTSAVSKETQRDLSKYQLGTTGFTALIAKRLYDSGMNDFKEC